MKSVTADAMATIELIRNRIKKRPIRQGLMKRRVKDRNLRQTTAKHIARRLNPFDVSWIVQGCEFNAVFDGAQNPLINLH
jgi:hypothetical protein